MGWEQHADEILLEKPIYTLSFMETKNLLFVHNSPMLVPNLSQMNQSKPSHPVSL
jgi:hypothetical protein